MQPLIIPMKVGMLLQVSINKHARQNRHQVNESGLLRLTKLASIFSIACCHSGLYSWSKFL